MFTDIQFETIEGVNVTQRIKEGRTFKFKSKEEAEEKANLIRSYVYDLNYYVGSKKTREVKPFGYAVPK